MYEQVELTKKKKKHFKNSKISNSYNLFKYFENFIKSTTFLILLIVIMWKTFSKMLIIFEIISGSW